LIAAHSAYRSLRTVPIDRCAICEPRRPPMARSMAL
jgi:hypothetical protein